MKKELFFHSGLLLCILLLFLGACDLLSPAPPTNTPTLTLPPTATSTSTSTPTATPSATPTPTPNIPVSLSENLPDVLEPISLNNAEKLKLLANYNLRGGRVSSSVFRFLEENGTLKLEFTTRFDEALCTITFGGGHKCTVGEFILGSDGQIYQTIHDKKNKVYEILPGVDGTEPPILSFRIGTYKINPVGLDIYHQKFFYTNWSSMNTGDSYMMDMTNGRNLIEWPDKSLSNRRFSFTPDGKYAVFLVNKQYNGHFIIFDLENNQTILKIKRSLSSFILDISPDGKSLVHGMKMEPIDTGYDFYYIMDLENPPTSTRYQIDESPGIHFSPDGSLLVLTFRSGKVRLLNAQDGSLVHEWQAHDDEGVYHIAFTQDMRYLATGTSGNIQIWGISDIPYIPDEDDTSTGNNTVSLMPCYPGETIQGTIDEDLPGEIDIISASSTLGQDNVLTVVFTLAEIPDKITINRKETPINYQEIAWGVEIDIDNDPSTTGYDYGRGPGFDIIFYANHSKKVGSEVTGSIEDLFRDNTTVYGLAPVGLVTLLYTGNGKIIVDQNAKTITISGQIPGINENSYLSYYTSRFLGQWYSDRICGR
jgi:WD40 repeat protein